MPPRINENNPPSLYDPNTTEADLWAFLMFSIAVAGKNATVTRLRINFFLSYLEQEYPEDNPAQAILALRNNWINAGDNPQGKLSEKLRLFGLGCHSQRARSFLELAQAWVDGLDITTCGVDELQKIYGVGPKTARFFLVYTRASTVRYAVLDVHVLGWLAEQGYNNIPKQTPSSEKKYKDVEEIFLGEANKRGLTPKQLDQAIWRSRRM